MISLIDIDPIVHIVSYLQYKSGNRTDGLAVKNHIQRFVNDIKKKSGCDKHIIMYQSNTKGNFRYNILPEYKNHRKSSEHIDCWKSRMLGYFEELGYQPILTMEVDDAQSILSKTLGTDNVLIVSSDKDMRQLQGKHYNPYKTGIEAEDRWVTMSKKAADKFFWTQVITGDSTDMPGELCGIQGVGPAKAASIIGDRTDYLNVIQEAYYNKYGDEGSKRAALTYKMVRLLTGEHDKDTYIEAPTLVEVYRIQNRFLEEALASEPSPSDLFSKPDAGSKLFN